MTRNETTYFRAEPLADSALRSQAPSIFAEGPQAGVSPRYTFVPTARILDGLRAQGWEAVSVEEQRIRVEARRGFQKHLIRLRLAEQMRQVAEWNVELVLVNSHDGGCVYQLHAGLFRRLCSNGLVISDTRFEAIRFRHARLNPDEVIQSSFRLVDLIPRVAGLIDRFRGRELSAPESIAFARTALAMRYGNLDAAPVETETLLKPRRAEDSSQGLWTTLNRVRENLVRGGIADHHRDRRSKLRALRGIDSKVALNK